MMKAGTHLSLLFRLSHTGFLFPAVAFLLQADFEASCCKVFSRLDEDFVFCQAERRLWRVKVVRNER